MLILFLFELQFEEDVSEKDVLNEEPSDEVTTSKKSIKVTPNNKMGATKNTRCMICKLMLPTFRTLLYHITFKHFKKELNKIVKERYAGLWKTENLTENQDHVCLDCGYRKEIEMGTRFRENSMI